MATPLHKITKPVSVGIYDNCQYVARVYSDKVIATFNLEKIMKSNRLIVAEGIMDSAAAEYRSENLASSDAVMEYAEGIEVNITEKEAEEILDVCKAMQSLLDAGEIPTIDEWYHDFKKPLSQTKGEKIAEAMHEKELDGAEYVTYGEGDLGVPVQILEARADFEQMDDYQIGEGTWYVCDKEGTITER